MNELQKILVVGGSGMLGEQLVRQLSGTGKVIYVMTRNPEKFYSRQFADVIIVQGDLTDITTLKNACKGMDAVIASAHAILGKGKYTSEKVDLEGHRALIDSAREAGIKYFVFTSIVGASADHPIDFYRSKFLTEEYLKASKIDYTIIRATAFMQMHIHELIGKSILQKGKATLFGNGDNATNFVSTTDVAQLIILCMQSPQYWNQIFEIGGPENVSRKEIIEKYKAQLGKEIKVNSVPRPVLRIMSSIIKPFHPGLSRIMRMSELQDRIDMRFDPNSTLKIFPIKLSTIDEFIAQGERGGGG